jgi:hypothetical protein
VPFYRREAEKAIGELAKLSAPSPEEKQAHEAIAGILAQGTLRQHSREALAVRCLAAVTAAPSRVEGFGHPEQQLELVWEVLCELAQVDALHPGAGTNPAPVPIRIWRDVFGQAQQALGAGDNVGIARPIAALWAALPLADELVPDAVFERYVSAKFHYLARVSASALARRGRHARLVELGWRLPPEQQVEVVLAALCGWETGETLSPRRVRNPVPTAPAPPDQEPLPTEEEFWLHCIRTRPLQSAYVLHFAMDLADAKVNPYNPAIREAYRDFLDAEAARSEAAAEDFLLAQNANELRTALAFLASWEREDDAPLFQRLLNHRGYDQHEVARGDGGLYLRQTFPVRVAAKEALVRLGQPLPAEIVMEKEVGIPVRKTANKDKVPLD